MNLTLMSFKKKVINGEINKVLLLHLLAKIYKLQEIKFFVGVGWYVQENEYYNPALIWSLINLQLSLINGNLNYKNKL